MPCIYEIHKPSQEQIEELKKAIKKDKELARERKEINYKTSEAIDFFEKRYGTTDWKKVRDMLCHTVKLVDKLGKFDSLHQDTKDWYEKHKRWDEHSKNMKSLDDYRFCGSSYSEIEKMIFDNFMQRKKMGADY